MIIIRDMVDWFQSLAMQGLPAPRNIDIATHFGQRSIAASARAVADAERAGLIVVQRGNASRVIGDTKGAWRTAGTLDAPHWRKEVSDPVVRAAKPPDRRSRRSMLLKAATLPAPKPSAEKPDGWKDPGEYVRKRNPFLTEAQQRMVDKRREETSWRISPQARAARNAPPVSRDEADRLIAEAVAAGRITRCPTVVCAPINNGAGMTKR